MTYFRLRSYLPAGHPDKHLEIGSEQTPAEFVAGLVAVFDDVRRVMRPDGCLFVNLADSYAGSGKGPSSQDGLSKQHTSVGSLIEGRTPSIEGVKPKSLFLVPQRFAIAMQEAGWIVRDEIVWAKKSAMPESVKDRCTKAWEPIYMFTKRGAYYWDQEAVRQPVAREYDRDGGAWAAHGADALTGLNRRGTSQNGLSVNASNPAGANLRNVWHLSPEPNRLSHWASYPTEIPRRCILAATSERGQCPSCGAPWVRQIGRDAEPPAVAASGLDCYGTGDHGVHRKVGGQYQKWLDAHPVKTTGWAPSCKCDAGEPVPQTVLDPFLGTGTTALVADRLGRNAVGIELNAEYVEIARRRLSNDAGMFADVAVSASETRQLTLEAS